MNRHPDSRLLTRADLPPDRYREVVAHVAECSRCRAIFLAEDPSRAFALLALASPPAAALERLSRGVREGVNAAAVRRRPRPRIAIASLAASLLLAGFLGGFLLRQEVPVPLPAVAAGILAEGALPADQPASGVELLSSPGDAQVMELAIGDTQVVMIFDEALDI